MTVVNNILGDICECVHTMKTKGGWQCLCIDCMFHLCPDHFCIRLMSHKVPRFHRMLEGNTSFPFPLTVEVAAFSQSSYTIPCGLAAPQRPLYFQKDSLIGYAICLWMGLACINALLESMYVHSESSPHDRVLVVDEVCQVTPPI